MRITPRYYFCGDGFATSKRQDFGCREGLDEIVPGPGRRGFFAKSEGDRTGSTKYINTYVLPPPFNLSVRVKYPFATFNYLLGSYLPIYVLFSRLALLWSHTPLELAFAGRNITPRGVLRWKGDVVLHFVNLLLPPSTMPNATETQHLSRLHRPHWFTLERDGILDLFAVLPFLPIIICYLHVLLYPIYLDTFFEISSQNERQSFRSRNVSS